MIRLAKRRGPQTETRRSGQALVEFAIIAPILLLLIMGLVDFARAWSAHHAIADAAREGTRMLVIHDAALGPVEATTAIEDRLRAARLDPLNAEILFDPLSGDAERGEPITVTIDYAYDFWILGAFMNWATGERQVNLISTITMRSE